MKRLILVFLFVGIAVFYFGCAEYNPTVPELNQSDKPTSLAKTKTDFFGTSIWIRDIDPGTETPLPNCKTLVKGQLTEWYDEADDSRVTGQSIWTINSLTEEDGISAKIWGRLR